MNITFERTFVEDAASGGSIEVVGAFNELDDMVGTIRKISTGEWIASARNPPIPTDREATTFRTLAEGKSYLAEIILEDWRMLKTIEGYETFHPVSTRNGMKGKQHIAFLERLLALTKGDAGQLNYEDGKIGSGRWYWTQLHFRTLITGFRGFAEIGLRNRLYLVRDRAIADQLLTEFPKDLKIGSELVLRGEDTLAPDDTSRMAI